MYKIEIIKEPTKEGEYTRMLLNGEHKRFSLTVDWQPYQGGYWLVNMQIEIDGQKWNCPEFLYELLIDNELLTNMAARLEDSINGCLD